MAAKRKRRVDARTRRHLILQAATKLFFERPYAEVTTRALADAAEVSEGLLFQHFASKREIYAEVVAAGSGAVAARLEDLFAPLARRPAAAEVEAIIRDLLAFWFRNSAFLRSFFVEPDAEEMRRTYYRVVLAQEAAMLPRLNSARRARLIPDVDPRALTRALVGLSFIFLITEDWLGGKELGPLDQKRLPRDLARLWMNLLAGPDQRAPVKRRSQTTRSRRGRSTPSSGA